MKFQLEIQQIEHTCLFKLIWGQGQQLSTLIPYPEALSQLYSAWRKAYLNYYKTALRARVRKPKDGQGIISLPQDRHRKLVQAEAKLLSEFQKWLRREELYEIRAQIAKGERKQDSPIHLFITCEGELEKLPWETWNLGIELNQLVQIARSPVKVANTNQTSRYRRRKPRILAILGDDTGLDLKSDRDSLQTLKEIATIELVTWQPHQSALAIKQQIKQALIDPNGWEVLFFAGHSNETTMTGGELAIAPNLTLGVSEIAEELKTAHNNGLQFALFNSCSGSSIAKSSIDLGLSQVAVMREPIHNQVAQVFLVRFLRALANYQNVQQALITGSQYLQQEEKLNYPSAYLIPSLYCHPDAPLYTIQPWGWRQKLQKWLPSRPEAIAAGALCFLSVMPPVRDFLLDRRTLVQSIYRDITGQIPSIKPSLTLIHIDEVSLKKAGIDRPVPMDRSYLARIVDSLVTVDAQIIGVDYLFDRTQPENDPILAQSVQSAVANQQTWFLFGAYKQIDDLEIGVAPETKIADPRWTLQGYTDGLPGYMSLLPQTGCTTTCPFAYLLGIIQQTASEKTTSETDIPQPSLTNQDCLRDSLNDYVTQHRGDRFISQVKLPTITAIVQYFGQQWLRPIQDFSLPPDLVYDRLPAWQLLDSPSNSSVKLTNNTVIIGSGGYSEAGLTLGADNFPTPLAIAYWNTRRGLNRGEIPFTGSEFLAYMTHNFLHRHLIVPIPQLWAVLTILLFVRGIKLNLAKTKFSRRWLILLLPIVSGIYGLIALQLYISQALILPWLLPSMAMTTYLIKPK